MKIAVIGSGIAGLTAAWRLKDKHHVTLYERWGKLGMDAHTAEIDCDGVPLSINVPMRVFYPEYYPSLTELYDELKVAYEPVQYSGSFSHFGGKTYFRYKNYWLGPYAVPFLSGQSTRSPAAIRLAAELIKLLRKSNLSKQRSSFDDVSIEDYLRSEGYSPFFADNFLYPTFAGICTCSYESVKRYPASIILDYLNSGLTWSKVNRLTHGTQDAASRLAASAADVKLGMDLKAVTANENGVEVTDGEGHNAEFDHVVIATQANQALRLLPKATAKENSALTKFGYEKSQVIVHQDASLAPSNPKEWAPVNFLMSDAHDKPMATIVMNRIHPQLANKPSVFETWNPFTEVQPNKVLLEASFERPIVSQDSLRGIEQLDALHQEPDRRIWFCGSYSKRGIPLLESATASANNIADKLNSLA
jgi:predicted NAD/FAD-binding protein